MHIPFLWALGFGLVLVGTLWRHWRFRNWMRGTSAPGDPRIESLLEDCKQAMGVPKAKRIGIAVTERVGVPALFGVWRPRLLLPPSALALETRELRTVILHELAHLKRRDTLLNWIMIGVRAWHWFNPFVWFAMRRLRADRELVCDAMVLECVGRSDRRLYGETLLKLLQRSPARSLSPSLVPVITPQPEIKRRIIMISNFKKPGRLAWLIPAVLAPVLCVLTFSRAAEQAEAPEAGVAPSLRTKPPTAAELQRSEKGIQRLEKMVEEKRSMITERMEMVDKLRRELGGVSDAAENGAVDRELLQMMEKERIVAEILASKQKALLDQLAGRGKEQLRQILPTAIPDTLLTSMLDRLSALQTESAKLSVQWGKEATNMKAISSAMEDLNKQIDRRIEGILEGLSAQVASHKATSESLSKQIAVTKARDADLSERSRPYFEAKRDLETQQRTYQTLLLRLLQEKVDAELIKDLQ
ncbi:MAG: M56 family metallopeptidase [Verrucomicrobiia bacterium]